MNRRELMKALVSGGVLTASGLWMPGQKLISIPSGQKFVSGSSIQFAIPNVSLGDIMVGYIQSTNDVEAYIQTGNGWELVGRQLT